MRGNIATNRYNISWEVVIQINVLRSTSDCLEVDASLFWISFYIKNLSFWFGHFIFGKSWKVRMFISIKTVQKLSKMISLWSRITDIGIKLTSYLVESLKYPIYLSPLCVFFQPAWTLLPARLNPSSSPLEPSFKPSSSFLHILFL